jgi:hypothetical protein
MRALNSTAELDEAKRAALSVFDLIGLESPRPFRESVEAKTLLFPVSDWTMFDEHEFAAVAGAALSIGEDVAYCVELPGISGHLEKV